MLQSDTFSPSHSGSPVDAPGVPAFLTVQLIGSLRYDWHRFTTEELESRGFSQSQGVQRISATVGIARASR